MTSRTESLWRATRHLRRFGPLTRDIDVDVAIVGGGVSGMTAAVLLAREGRRVAVLERDAVGSGETGSTTSHLTEAVDARYQTIAKDFGAAAAALVARSSRDAIDRIEAFVRESGHDCGFERLPGYLYTERQSDVDWLANELDAAQRAGCPVQWVDRVPLPFATHGAVRWDHQAQVHATEYLNALIADAAAHGVRIHDSTQVLGVHEDAPCRIETDHGVVRAGQVFVAANVPINNRVLLHTKIAAYRTYVVAAELGSSGSRSPEPEARSLFWDTDDPYHYTRRQEVNGRTYLIVGGEDHRTGMETETDACYARLLAYARDRFGLTDARYSWSGQIIEPVDGLPYIGLNAAAQHVYVATGYAGNGMTFGTLAGMIVSDLILGRPNAYAELYDATRVTPIASAVEYVKENLPYPAHLLTDRLTSVNADEKPVQALRSGEGGIFTSDEGKIAVCRDGSGVLHACSAVCTHLGCDVAWNHAEQSWDCPCHGSRFSPDGQVINGPAVSALRPVPVKVSAR